MLKIAISQYFLSNLNVYQLFYCLLFILFSLTFVFVINDRNCNACNLIVNDMKIESF